tara:strand:- start:6775 stop:7356 length:582 start_codon:yes stop_codon:yes gene_type:complete
MLLDRMANQLGESWAEEKKWSTQIFRSGDVFFLKPQTFMNESGKAVAAVSKFYQLSPDQVIVVSDDVDLPLGSLRFRADGSAGGHNGIKSIISHLGTQAFPRLKVGIGRSEGAKKMIGHVLGKFETCEQEILEKTLQEAQSALECALDRGLDTAMNQFNRKPKSKKKQRTKPKEEAEESSSAETTSPEPNCDE